MLGTKRTILSVVAPSFAAQPFVLALVTPFVLIISKSFKWLFNHANLFFYQRIVASAKLFKNTKNAIDSENQYMNHHVL